MRDSHECSQKSQDYILASNLRFSWVGGLAHRSVGLGSSVGGSLTTVVGEAPNKPASVWMSDGEFACLCTFRLNVVEGEFG